MKKDYFLLHLSVFIAGFTGVLGRLITLDSTILVWWRMAAAAVIMWIYLRIVETHGRASLQRYKFRDVLQMGGVGMLLCLHWVFFYASIKASNVSIGVVCFSLVGFFTALFEPIINKHRFSGREFLFSLLTILGIYLIHHQQTPFFGARIFVQPAHHPRHLSHFPFRFALSVGHCIGRGFISLVCAVCHCQSKGWEAL